MRLQKEGRLDDAVELLTEAIEHFPRDVQLNICLGVSYMNLERYGDALRRFEPYAHDEQTARFIQICRQAMR
jgi:tetratricopeptide (TPR) repeat protein